MTTHSADLTYLRYSTEELPLIFSESVRAVPEAEFSGLLARKSPELIIPYKEAAHLIINYLERSGPFSGKRVGIALAEMNPGETLVE